MLRIAILTLIATLPAQSSAEDPCTLANNFCVPFVGCSLDGTLSFSGRGYGQGTGTLAAERSDGLHCSGTWHLVTDGQPGALGIADFTCADGMSGTASYTWLHAPSGTVTGTGSTDNGRDLRFWSGHLIADYIAQDPTLDPALISCVTEAIPTS